MCGGKKSKDMAEGGMAYAKANTDVKHKTGWMINRHLLTIRHNTIH